MKINTSFVIIFVCFMLVGCVSSDSPTPETTSPVQSSPKAGEEKQLLVKQYMDAGQAFEQEGRLNSALEQYALALTVLPDHVQASTAKQEVTAKLKTKAQFHYKQGLAYDKKGQYEAARKEYLTALQNWPDHDGAKEQLTPGGVTDGNREYIIHTLKYGESVSKISLIYYGNLKKHDIIGKFNLLKDAQKVRAGQRLKVPVIKGISLADLNEKQTTYLEGRRPTSSDKSFDTMDDETPVLTEERHEEETNAPEQKTDIDDYDSMTATDSIDDSIDDTMDPAPDDSQMLEAEPIDDPVEELDETQTASIDPQPIDPQTMPSAPIESSTESLAIQEEDPKKAEIIEPDPVNFYQLGVEQFKEKKYKTAIPNFTKALNEEPDNEILRDYLFQSHFQNGLYLYSKSRYLTAKDNFSQALTYNPACEKCQDNIQKSENSYKEKHYNLGIHYFGKENLKKAISEWEKVQEIDPAYKEIAPNLKKAQLLFNRLEAIKKSSSD